MLFKIKSKKIHFQLCSIFIILIKCSVFHDVLIFCDKIKIKFIFQLCSKNIISSTECVFSILDLFFYDKILVPFSILVYLFSNLTLFSMKCFTFYCVQNQLLQIYLFFSTKNVPFLIMFQLFNSTIYWLKCLTFHCVPIL